MNMLIRVANAFYNGFAGMVLGLFVAGVIAHHLIQSNQRLRGHLSYCLIQRMAQNRPVAKPSNWAKLLVLAMLSSSDISLLFSSGMSPSS